MECNFGAIGYSNGVPYFLTDFDNQNNTGLIQIEGWDNQQWCSFDHIEILKNLSDIGLAAYNANLTIARIDTKRSDTSRFYGGIEEKKDNQIYSQCKKILTKLRA